MVHTFLNPYTCPEVQKRSSLFVPNFTTTNDQNSIIYQCYIYYSNILYIVRLQSIHFRENRQIPEIISRFKHLLMYAFLQVIFEGVRGTSYTGDIAIDDIKMLDGPCNQPGKQLDLFKKYLIIPVTAPFFYIQIKNLQC